MMNMETIAKAYRNGYRTRYICCAIAAVIAARFEEEDYASILNDVYNNVVEDTFSDITIVDIKILVKMEELWDEEYFLTPRRRRIYEDCRMKTIVFKYPSEDGSWVTRERPSRAAVTITSDGEMSMVKLSGVDPTAEQVAAMVTAAAAASFEVYCYDRRKRKFPFNITVYEGQSGCRDVTMTIYEKIGNHYKRRRYGGDSLHISMAGKIADFGMYLGDALEILNWCTVEDYKWSYYKMYKDTKLRLTNLGIKFSRPPRSMSEIMKSRVTYDPTR